MSKTKKIPVRVCVGCRETKNKKELIRIVKSAEGDFSVDNTGKKSGRGAYICNNSECFDKSVKTKGLEKSFKQSIPVSVVDQLRESVGEDK
ncbi:hypothetical protein GGQ84_002111 [Desulfitispora alkaliphila]|uniref:RNase P modulator RnpM n=1 Tax=Desulfitispora alkaliphila TaxID=622674 RepID=UPI003D22E313